MALLSHTLISLLPSRLRHRWLVLPLLVSALLLLASCVPGSEDPPATQMGPSAPTDPPAPERTLTSPPAAPKAVLLAPEGSEPDLTAELEAALIELTAETGWRFERIASMDGLGSDPARIGVVLPPSPDLVQQLDLNGTLWVAVGIPGLPEHPALSVIGENGFRPDRQAFLAGYISAVLGAPNWRAGVLVGANDPAAAAIRTGFENGLIFYCGLCRPVRPPYLSYPQLITVQATGGPDAVRQGGLALLDQSVEVAFIRGTDVLAPAVEILAEAGVILLTDGHLPEGARGQAAAAIRPDPAAALRLIWADLVGGTSGHRLEMPINLVDVNSVWITPGKGRVIDELLEDLLAGYIDTGVDLATLPAE